MKDPDIDAVVVVTPTQFHHDVVLAAAAAGKHVFCEKPMASTEQECDEMIEACRKANVKLQIGFMRRFDKSFRRAKEALDAGQIEYRRSSNPTPTVPASRRNGCMMSGKTTVPLGR